MAVFEYILMGFLVICAISVSFSRNLLNSFWNPRILPLRKRQWEPE